MTHRDCDQAVHPLRQAAREPPGQHGSPVVTDHRGPVDTGAVQQTGEVTDEDVHPVVRNVRWSTRPPEAPQIRGDHPMPGGGEQPDLVPPQPPGIREPMQQNDRTTRTGRRDIQLNVTQINRPFDNWDPDQSAEHQLTPSPNKAGTPGNRNRSSLNPRFRVTFLGGGQ